MEEIKTEDLEIIFLEAEPESEISEKVIDIRFRLKDRRAYSKDLLKKDLEDLGRWRKFKELNSDLKK